MYKRRNGFTIVELLIVIVVIGILAAIALNSYAGIQRNARNQQNVSLAQAWHKALLAYAVANGNAYPSEMAGGTEVYFCLGSYPDVDSNGTGDCQVAANGTTSLASTIPSFNTKMRAYIDTTATASGAKYLEGDNSNSSGVWLWIIPYATLNGTAHAWYLAYVIESPATCAYGKPIYETGGWGVFGTNAPSGYTYGGSAARWCAIPLPDPAKV